MNTSRPPATRGFAVALAMFMIVTGVIGCSSNPLARKTSPAPSDAGGTVLTSSELRTLADNAYAAQDWALAEARYGELTRREGTTVDAWLRLGNIYARTARPELAMTAYEEAVSRNPADARAWHNLALLQMKATQATLTRMQQAVPANDPLRARMDALADGLTGLIEGPGPAPAAAPLDLRSSP